MPIENDGGIVARESRVRPPVRSSMEIMDMEGKTSNLGWRVYGIGVMALGLVCLAFGDFHPGQPVPKEFPHRTVLAYAAAGFMLVAGAATVWRRTVAWGSLAITAYFALVV